MFKTFLTINKKTMNEIIIGRDGVELSKAEFAEEVRLFAKGLSELKIQKGQTIMIATPLIIEGVVMTFAANAIGVKVAYANYEGTEREIFQDMLRFKPEAMFRFDGKELWVYTGEEAVRFEEFKEMASASTIEVEKIMGKNAVGFGTRLYLQTSGSTATRAKGLPFSNWNIFAALYCAAKSTGTSTHSKEVEKALAILNFRHPYGWMPLFVNVMGGNRVELATGASPEEIRKWHELRPSYIYGTPQFLRDFMRETPKDANLSFLNAFFCAGDATDEDLFREAEKFFSEHGAVNAEVRNNYGLGELLCVGTTSDGVPHKEGTSGVFYHGLGMKWIVVDENMNPVPTGTAGEFIVHSPTTIREYFGNKEATKKAFIRRGLKKYFRTGDYGSVDAEGYVRIKGRMKRFYIPRGATDKVNCETIEKVLAGIKEFVKDNAVVIYELPDGSKTSAAFVVPTEGTPETEAMKGKLMILLEERLQSFQMPQRIEFIDEIPMLPAGKVDYVKLEKELKERMS